jgi:branched-chain amino acid transport system ATP-binding protein
MTALLEIKDLRVHYGGAEVLKGVSCEVEAGSVVTLLGGNGAGKSTTLRAITGLVPLSGGEIWFDGKRIDGLPPQKIVELGVRHVLEGRALFPYMSVLENLKVGAYLLKDRSQMDSMLTDIFTHFPILKERQGQQARTLSGGEQQMLAIARALMSAPKLLLLDEPTLGLAPLVVADIFAIIREINTAGTTILLVEQNVKQAMKVSSYTYVFETGKIALSGPSKELLQEPRIKASYLGQ